MTALDIWTTRPPEHMVTVALSHDRAVLAAAPYGPGWEELALVEDRPQHSDWAWLLLSARGRR